MKALTGLNPVDPIGGGTFVTHHMVFHASCVAELLRLMQATTKSGLPWPLLIMSMSQKHYRFSEYKTYCAFMTRFHPHLFHYHPFGDFGEGGLRFREANDVIDSLLAACRFSDGGLSYEQMKTYFFHRTWKKKNNTAVVAPQNSFCQNSYDIEKRVVVRPAYVQLDHVYGLDGVDLNLSGPITASRCSFSLAAFSRLTFREIISLADLHAAAALDSSGPPDLFKTPLNVAVMRRPYPSVSGRVLSPAADDSSIQRLTMGTILKTEFCSTQSVVRTTPRRPPVDRYYYGAGAISSKSHPPAGVPQAGSASSSWGRQSSEHSGASAQFRPSVFADSFFTNPPIPAGPALPHASPAPPVRTTMVLSPPQIEVRTPWIRAL